MKVSVTVLLVIYIKIDKTRILVMHTNVCWHMYAPHTHIYIYASAKVTVRTEDTHCTLWCLDATGPWHPAEHMSQRSLQSLGTCSPSSFAYTNTYHTDSPPTMAVRPAGCGTLFTEKKLLRGTLRLCQCVCVWVCVSACMHTCVLVRVSGGTFLMHTFLIHF